MKIDIKTIKELAENIEKYNLEELEVESDGVKVVLKKEKPTKVAEACPTQPILHQYITTNEEIETCSVPQKEVEEKEEDYILSPMIGTFYRSSAPGNPAFIEIGDDVAQGDTLCIIEAMKLMNEVKATKRCKIVKILVEDGQVVKKGEKLFVVE